MKAGDRITCLGPNNTIVTGDIVVVEPMATRPGWNVTLVPLDLRHNSRFILRPEDEGRSWIYGDDEAQVAALRTAEALWERTKQLERPESLRDRLKRAKRKTGTL